MIELVESILRHQKHILGGGLLLRHLLKFLMLLLAHLSGLCHGLIQLCHPLLQFLDFALGAGNGLFLKDHCLLQALDLVAQRLGLALSLEALLVAVVLLVVIVLLFLVHQHSHVVNHAHHC
eukprot:Skav216667  [mRNA]  locus=scaffold930:105054:109511:+ [translate_table: standard]